MVGWSDLALEEDELEGTKCRSRKLCPCVVFGAFEMEVASGLTGVMQRENECNHDRTEVCAEEQLNRFLDNIWRNAAVDLLQSRRLVCGPVIHGLRRLRSVAQRNFIGRSDPLRMAAARVLEILKEHSIDASSVSLVISSSGDEMCCGGRRVL